MECAYQRLAPDDSGLITARSPNRGSLQKQEEFLKHPQLMLNLSSSSAMLIAIIKYNRADVHLQTLACTAIAYLLRQPCLTREYAVDFWKYNAIEWILSAYQSNPQPNVEYLTALNTTFHSMVFSLQLVEQYYFPNLQQSLVIDIALNSLRDIGSDISLLLSAIWVLVNMSSLSPENRRLLNDNEILERTICHMEQNRGNVDIQEKGCSLLRNIADLSDNHVSFSRFPKAIDSILDAIDTFSSCRRVQISGLGAIRNLVSDLECCTIVISSGGLKQVLGLLESCEEEPEIVELALNCLSRVLESCTDQVRVLSTISHHSFQVVVKLLRKYRSNVAVQIASLEVISMLSQFTNFETTLVSSLVVEGVIRSLKRFTSEQGVQWRGIQALLVLSSYPVLLDELITKGSIGRALNAMQKHVGVLEIHEASCGFLHKMCLQEHCRGKLVKKGAFVRLLASIDAFPTSDILQERCLGSLALLTSDNESRRGLLTRLGGLRLVLSCMKNHESNGTLQQYGADTLSNLALNGYNQVQIASKHGIERIMEAMANHANNPLVLERCCAALWNLSVHPRNQVRIAEKGALKSIVDAMEAYPGNEKLQQTIAGSLRNLSLNTTNQVLLMELGAIQLIILSMHNHIGSIPLQQEACGALVHLALNPDNRRLIASSGGFPQLLSSMETHHNNSQLCSHICGAFLNLTLDKVSKTTALDTPLIRALLSCMNHFPMDPVIHERCIRVFLNLSSLSRGQVQMMELGVTVRVRDISKRFPQSKSISKHAYECLSKLGYATIDRSPSPRINHR